MVYTGGAAKNGWAGVERRSGVERRTFKERRSSQDTLFSRGIFLFNAQLLGLILGLLFGLVVFIATNWLIMKGGHVSANGEYVVGPNLQLLSQFFIGYRVSFLGSIIGFSYAFAVGTLSGALIGWIYNKIVYFRN